VVIWGRNFTNVNFNRFHEDFVYVWELELNGRYPTRVGDCLFDAIVYKLFFASRGNVNNVVEIFVHSIDLRVATTNLIKVEVVGPKGRSYKNAVHSWIHYYTFPQGSYTGVTYPM